MGQRGARKIFGIVLVKENIELLQNDLPIHMNCEEINLPDIKFHELVIIYSETYEGAIKKMKETGAIDNSTVMKTTDRKLQ